MKKIISILLVLSIICSFVTSVIAVEADKLNAVTQNVGEYLYKSVNAPVVGSVGGEWTVLGLARSKMDIPYEYFENYYDAVSEYVKACDGILHSAKYTEYSRVAIALTAIGKNPQDVGGYNLLMPLGDFEKTIRQGINGAIWALIALDCGNYDIPKNEDAKVQATREMYVNHILEKQTPDGGWSLSGENADPDVTGMALQALSNYQDNSLVLAATQKALGCLSGLQKENGGFSNYETENPESSVQVLIALCELGISVDDQRFVKNGKTLLDNILTFYDEGKGFKHTHNEETNQMATEQCFYALIALNRLAEGDNSLYNMSDVNRAEINPVSSVLTGKNEDVRKTSVITPDKTFSDILNHKNKNEIECLASRGIISGTTGDSFEPDSTMTRAEFATIVTKGLGLYKEGKEVFSDVTENDWFYNYVNTAYHYGIIKGVSETEFNPYGTITRQEAAVMITRAAKLCGIDTQMDAVAVRDILAQFFDYVLSADWSQNSLAFCYKEKILNDSAMDINPYEEVKRSEVASMLYNMLLLARLI